MLFQLIIHLQDKFLQLVLRCQHSIINTDLQKIKDI